MKNLKAVLAVKFNATHDSEELVKLFNQDLEAFRNVPGLLQKYYIAEEVTGAKGGIYIFDNREARTTFWNSDLAKEIPALYGVKLDTLRIEQYDIEIDLNGAL
jgi:hypothetical protein